MQTYTHKHHGQEVRLTVPEDMVDPDCECPDCGEGRVDRLELQGDEVTCLTCGEHYRVA